VHETYPVGVSRVEPELNPLQAIQPETVATELICKVNGVYPVAQVYPVIKFLLTST